MDHWPLATDHWLAARAKHTCPIYLSIGDQVYRDKCFPIEGTDVGDRACVIYECQDTEGDCPPQEYPMCDG